jgi:hypothetical protein
MPALFNKTPANNGCANETECTVVGSFFVSG